MKRCIHCGRKRCRCGQPVRNRACSRHGATLEILSIVAVGSQGTEWYEVAKCSVPGCSTVRNFDKNRTLRPAITKDKTVRGLEKKFGAKLKAVFYHDEKQDCRPRSSSRVESNSEIEKCDSCGSEFTGDFCGNCGQDLP